MTIVVFLGPTLALDEAERILPGAVFLPPAKQADVLSALADGPSAIGLIDGEFHQSRSVWHKEILLALERGVHVFGAASMGALRAAELERFGMAGVGTVFTQFASGELIDDDEVAVLYACEDGRYVQESEPMVNIRATLDAARLSGAVGARTCEIARAEAKALHYADRCRPAVLQRLRDRGVSPDEVRSLGTFWRSSAVDVKAQDARLLLHTLHSFEQDPPPPRSATEHVVRTASADVLYDRERRVRVGGEQLALDEIAEFVRLHHPRSDSLTASALNRALVLVLATLLHIDPSEADIDQEVERWTIRHPQEHSSMWLGDNHLSADEFRQLAREAAQCRLLWRWLLASRQAEGSTRLLLDHLRWEDEYAALAIGAARQAGRVGGGHGLVEEFGGIEPDDIAREHAEWSGVRIDADLGTWAEDAGFDTAQQLVLALGRAKRARQHAGETPH